MLSVSWLLIALPLNSRQAGITCNRRRIGTRDFAQRTFRLESWNQDAQFFLDARDDLLDLSGGGTYSFRRSVDPISGHTEQPSGSADRRPDE